MIQLHPDYLFFQTQSGEMVPCSAESVTIELIGDAASFLDPMLVREAAAAVVHFFKYEQQRDVVSVGEFSQALEKVLRGLGFTVVGDESPDKVGDLAEVARVAEDGFEMLFYQRLREEFRRQASTPSEVMMFRGLRRCVKRLLGMKRWGPRCEVMSDQIVTFLRGCLVADGGSIPRGLVVI